MPAVKSLSQQRPQPKRRSSARLSYGQSSIPLILREHGLRSMHVKPRVANPKNANGSIEASWLSTANRSWSFCYTTGLNPAHAINVIIIDIDNSTWIESTWKMVELVNRNPNWIVLNRATDHIQMAFVLDTPVHKYNTARSKPQRYLAQVADALVDAFNGDHSCAGDLMRNPVWSDPTKQVETHWMTTRPWTLTDLKDLARRIKKEKPAIIIPKLRPLHIESRNWTIFLNGLSACFKSVNLDTPAIQIVTSLNDQLRFIGKSPMDAGEVGHIAKHIEKRRANPDPRYDHSSANQARRGRRSGTSRRRKQSERDSRILDLRRQGWTQRRIAADVGISQVMVHKVLKRTQS